MIPIKEITRTDYERMLAHKVKAHYNQEEANDLLGLVRTYINSGHSGCFSCGKGFREIKTTLAEWLVAHKDEIENILNAKENPVVVEEAKPIEEPIQPEEIKPLYPKKNKSK